MEIGNIINIGLLFLTVVGLAFTIIQLRQTKKINRASLAKELYWTLYNDSEIREIFYIIEWSEYSTCEMPLEDMSEDFEQKVDKLLSFFEIVCSMYYRRVLTRNDMNMFNYEMNRVYLHPGIQEYFNFLSTWQTKQRLGKSFVNYKRYCAEYKKKSNHINVIT